MSTQLYWPFTEVPTDDISIYESPECFLRDFESEGRGSQVAFAAYWLQAEILNGGLGQFFSNDTGVLALEAAAACLTLGLNTLASRIENAMRWFGDPYPRKRERRQELLRTFELENVDGGGAFSQIDNIVADLIYDEAGGLHKAAINYLKMSSV